MANPIQQFQQWWQAALADSPLHQKSAVCVATIDERGFPAARFVDLKQADESGFVFCSDNDAAKGRHISRCPKVAMTCWWDHVGYQVRIVGVATSISEAEADTFWHSRSRDAQLVTVAFEQSAEIADGEDLAARVSSVSRSIGERPVPRPKRWGGYRVKPQSIEFLQFSSDRLHVRERYEFAQGDWTMTRLQP